VDEFFVSRPTENVNDWMLVVAGAFDGVIDLHYGNFDSFFDRFEECVAGIDIGCTTVIVARNRLCFCFPRAM